MTGYGGGNSADKSGGRLSQLQLRDKPIGLGHARDLVTYREWFSHQCKRRVEVLVVGGKRRNRENFGFTEISKVMLRHVRRRARLPRAISVSSASRG
jgi:hypothetical protein